MAGKGSEPRPVNQDRYASNYERIFGTDEEVKARRQLRLVHQEIAKVSTDPNMSIESIPLTLDVTPIDPVVRTVSEQVAKILQ